MERHIYGNERHSSNKYNIITRNTCQYHASVTFGISLYMFVDPLNPFAGAPVVLLLSPGKISSGAK